MSATADPADAGRPEAGQAAAGGPDTGAAGPPDTAGTVQVDVGRSAAAATAGRREAGQADAGRSAAAAIATANAAVGQAAAVTGQAAVQRGSAAGEVVAAESTVEPADFTLHRRFMLRVAGLPVEAVHRLRCPGTRRWADRVLDAEQRLSRLGAELSDPLTVLVKATEDDRERRAVLALRRQVFNDRLPRDPDAVRELAAAIGGGTGDLLTGWLDARLRLEELRAEGGPLLGGDLARSRAELRALAGEERLRLALGLASPTLDSQLDAFIADRSATPDKRARKKERSLLSYVYRTACKTSPFSTFTAVAEGRFTPVTADPDVRAGGAWTSHPRLNVVVLARLAELIAADSGRRGDLPVALSAGWELDEDRVRFVRRSVTAGDDSAAVSFDAAHDRLFFLRHSGTLQRMIALFHGERPLRYAELAAWLTGETGATADEAAHYAATLLDLGILQTTGLATDVHAPDPLRGFQQALRALDRPWADATADRLEAPAAHVAGYAGADAATRRALLGALRRDLLDIQRELGATAPSLPQTLLYEDVKEGPVEADLTEWTELAAAPLHALTGMLPAFDVALPQRLTLKGFFLARYGRGGRCDDLLRLVHDFHEDIFTQYLQFTSLKSPWAADGSHAAEENWLGMPEVTALDRARAEFTRRMRERWAAHPGSGAPVAGTAGELHLDEETVSAVTAELAPLGTSFAPHSHFLQLARREGDPLVVLNNSYGGLCFPFTRFTHCFDADAGTEETDRGEGMSAGLRETLRGWQPPGAVFAEITAGSATTNLNLHGRLTDYEIVCPGESSTVPAEGRIDLDDLYAEHDTDDDRLVLRSRRLGREVVPLYLGYLVPMVLPEVPRTLLLFSPTSRASVDVWRGVPEGPASDGVTARPRVRYRSLVLHRRSWTAAPGALPVREPGLDEAEFFLRWQRWRRDHGLPDRVFATVHQAGGEGAEEGAEGGPAGFGAVFGGSKPLYVDFDSPLSLIALDGLAGGARTRTVFEEMLPGEDELHVRSPRGHHVAELAVEIVPRAAAPAGAARHGRQDSSL